ncbi:hypothetical protein J3B02_004071 [Coemansia erecta]|nr:hypothetical protein J3B02_004071 [Coemansia erecta]KAJ2874707.1 hypothetical protein FB639_004074 [Coemansia asiatica]
MSVTRDEVLQLILRQLSAYGYPSLSQAVATHTKVQMTAESSSRLEELVSMGLRSERQQRASDALSEEPRTAEATGEEVVEDTESTEAGLDNDLDLDRRVPAVVPYYKVWYKTKHKGAATAAAFSADGRYIATGSADSSLKLIEVDRVRNPAAGSARREDKPVIRTLYNHEAGITGMAFHPNGLVLASCSTDHTVKLFDLSAAYGKYAFQSTSDNYAFYSISFHPSGEYLAAATDASEVRLLNVRTSKTYLLRAGSAPNTDQHSAGLTHVAYAGSGAMIASTSRDGCVKLWDGRSGTCVRTLDHAHGGAPTTAALFSRSSRYLLTTGLDSAVRLWDVAAARVVNSYEGATMDAFDARAVFSHDETLVMVPDARTNSIACWDTASARLLKRCADHKARVTCVAASPITSALMSCSVDECVRYWSPDDS